jgi:hypothetical protein
MEAQESGKNEYAEESDGEEGDDKKSIPTLPEFNVEEHLKNWDEENPEVMIQENTEDYIDNDWVLTEEETEEKIKAYFTSET